MPLAKPKRLKQDGSTPSHHRSRRQESEVAKRIGGRKTPASGALAEKGDVRLKGVVRIECKTTKHKSFSVTQEMLGKIEDAALASGELPVIVVEFLNAHGRPQGSAAVMPMWALDQIANLAKDRTL